MLGKVLVANRGEIALRVIRACRELGIRTAAVYSEADRWSAYVAAADEAHLLGPAPAAESYLRIDRLLEIARRAKARAVHPGYGFLAENPAFSAACTKAGIRFVGPPARAIRALGNKIAARKAAERLGIPVVPGVSGAVDAARARAFGARRGYPILLKAAAGGGGRGLRVVRAARDLDRAFREASAEAAGAFGDGTILLEKYLDRPRHVEIQVLADAHGNVVHLGERECSIQRRHQKLLEETPSVAVDDALRRRLGETAVRLARVAGYVNAGTCEFLLDEEGRFYFLEVNSRLQVEHPVTEMTTGLDLVKLQLAVAAGERLPFRQEDVRPRGHALEVRVCAENPFAGFAPAAGEVEGLRFPSGPFVRVDSDLAPGARISVHYDSLIAKLVVWAPDRAGAIARALRALREFHVTGVPTTIPFHLQLLRNRAFAAGRIHTRFAEEEFKLTDVRPGRAEEAAVLAAALESLRRNGAIPGDAAARPLSPWKLAAREER